MTSLFKRVILTACLLNTITPLTLYAQVTSTSTLSYPAYFRPEKILDDEDIIGLGNVDQRWLEEFLLRRGSLGKTLLPDIDGRTKPAAEIIWRVATSYAINPKYLLALLQKEQSLVEDPSPTQDQFDWATGYGICDACSKTDPALQEFKGFASQLEWAAKQHREKYLPQLLSQGRTISGLAPHAPAIIDGQLLIPANQATVMLYSYTPHVAGNLNLWRIWQRWFGLSLLDGSIVQDTVSKRTYLIRYGKRRWLKTPAVVASLTDPGKIQAITEERLATYADGKPIGLPNYSLVESDGRRYLIDGSKKRLIINEQVFHKLGFNEDELLPVSSEDLADYTPGPDINLSTMFPTGALVKDPSGQHWYVDSQGRHAITHPHLLSLYFRTQPAKPVSKKKLSSLPLALPYTLRNGELVKAPTAPTVYVIDEGVRRPIANAATFAALGWSWNNVVTLPENLLVEYPVDNEVIL